LFTVRAGAFHPAPAVDSAAIRLTPLAAPLIADAESAAFRSFVVGLFGLRRKQLVRGLRERFGVGQVEAAGWLREAGLEATQRPENLAPDQFVRLFRAVGEQGDVAADSPRG
jgi:16S rRNA (adenine1518-N6/adenine1519-N6)-dimethyltransferase